MPLKFAGLCSYFHKYQCRRSDSELRDKMQGRTRVCGWHHQWAADMHPQAAGRDPRVNRSTPPGLVKCPDGSSHRSDECINSTSGNRFRCFFLLLRPRKCSFWYDCKAEISTVLSYKYLFPWYTFAFHVRNITLNCDRTQNIWVTVIW